MNRVIPGILMAGGWFFLLFWGGTVFFWMILVGMAGYALHEFFRMAMPSLTGWRLLASVVACLAPILAAFWGQDDLVLAGVIVSLLAIVALAFDGYRVIDDVFRFTTSSGFATLYISLCLAHVALLRFLPQGPFWLSLLIVIVAGSDTGAYYAGRAFGRRKLFPLISPKKTVAGGIGGLIAGVVAAQGANLFFLDQAEPLPLLLVAILLVLVGMAGDLTESMIKRSVGVKDSGTLLFGHGGLLDRIDSLLLAGPVLYYLLHLGFLQ